MARLPDDQKDPLYQTFLLYGPPISTLGWTPARVEMARQSGDYDNDDNDDDVDDVDDVDDDDDVVMMMMTMMMW